MKPLLHLITALALLVLLTGFAWAGKILNDALVTNPFSHRIWQDVIESAVDPAGNTDFLKLRAHPARLNEYLGQLAVVSPENRPQYFRHSNDELAYWINAYNALTLRQILNRYPLHSLEGLSDFETNTRYVLGGTPTSLAEIRAKIQTRFPAQPTAMMALSRFTQDSPPLAHTAFTGAELASQLSGNATSILSGLVTESPDCPELPYWLQETQTALFVAEQHRRLGEQAIDWNRVLRPLLTPENRGRLDCPGQVRFAAPDRRLREIPQG